MRTASREDTPDTENRLSHLPEITTGREFGDDTERSAQPLSGERGSRNNPTLPTLSPELVSHPTPSASAEGVWFFRPGRKRGTNGESIQ
jgi:hypothetical protein